MLSPGDPIIKQGEDGDFLYVVDQGELDCTKTFAGKNAPTWLKLYKPGESFGELSLLYNAPRAANITAKTKSVLFGLDRDCFNNIVKDAAMKKRELYDQILQKVSILATMDAYERQQVADAVKVEKLKSGQFVIQQAECILGRPRREVLHGRIWKTHRLQGL